MGTEDRGPAPLIDGTKAPNASGHHRDTSLHSPSRQNVDRTMPDRVRRRIIGASWVGAALASVGWPPGFISAARGSPVPTPKTHRVVILVDSDGETVMHHAIGYAINLNRYYDGMDQRAAIEVVANGSGLRLFRADTSPLQEPLTALRNMLPNVTYSVCNSSKLIVESREGHAMPLLPGARLVPFGIGRVVDLQEAGWTYVHA